MAPWHPGVLRSNLPGKCKRGLFNSFSYAPLARRTVWLEYKGDEDFGKIEHTIHPSSSASQACAPTATTIPHLASRQHHERPDFPIFAVGDESDRLATLCVNRREGILGPVGRPARPTILFHRGPFAHANGTIPSRDNRIDGQGHYFLSGGRGQGEARILGAHQPQFQLAPHRARRCCGDRVEGEIPRTRFRDGTHALADYIWLS